MFAVFATLKAKTFHVQLKFYLH